MVKTYNKFETFLQDAHIEKGIIASNNSSTNILNAALYIEKGNNFYLQGSYYCAIEAYKKAVIFNPNASQAYTNMGNAFCEIGNLNTAIEFHNKAISLKPDYAIAYNSLGNVFYKQGKFKDAIDACKRAIYIKPDFAQAYNNIGNIQKYLGKIDISIKAFEKSVSLQPSNSLFQLDYSFALLNKGFIKEGLDKYEWRWRTPKFLNQKRNFLQPKWDGKKSLNDKKILIWSEQGIGDTIKWSSVLPLVSSMAEFCILECQEKLVPLLKRSFPNIHVRAVDISNDLKRTDFDFQLPMGSLYRFFLDDITKKPKPNFYLKADPDRISFWRDRLNSVGKGKYIGVNWKSANMEFSRHQNYASISELSPVFSVPNAIFFNLQYKDFEDDLRKIYKQTGIKIHNFDDLDHYNNIDDVAAFCAALDVVVSTNNAVPYISSGVGTVTKLVNWKQSPWNNILHNPNVSTVNIFERDTDVSWQSVFNLISMDLSKLTKKQEIL